MEIGSGWIAALTGIVVIIMQAANLYMTSQLKLEIANVKLWVTKNFVSKEHFLDTIYFWSKADHGGNRQREGATHADNT